MDGLTFNEKEIEEILASKDEDEPIVENAKVECSQSPNRIATMYIKEKSSDTRNGNRVLKDTDIYFFPHNFGYCRNQKGRRCLPKIESNGWKNCDYSNIISGRPSVTGNSFMVCTYGRGLIQVKENGQIPAQSLPYGKHLSADEIESLITYFFNKIDWSATEDIENAEYIAKCMKLAGMDTRMSIEFFLLTCCVESEKGDQLQERGGGPGKGFLQLTNLGKDTYQDIAKIGNEWRDALEKDGINWQNTPPSQAEIEEAFLDRDKLAWEGSIYFWCLFPKRENDPLNDYIVGFEMNKENTIDEDDKYTPEGLYFVVQCFVNGGDVGEAAGMRRGDINDYPIDGTGSTSYVYIYLKEKVKKDEKFTVHKAPNGTVARAKVYMEYYDREEPIWNFSDEILENWDSISS